MDDSISTNAMYEIAISSEKAAELFYRGLEAKFAHLPAVANFWREYAQEEAMHTAELEAIRKAKSPEQLSAPADPHFLAYVRDAAQFSAVNALNDIETPNDAYQLARRLECSKTYAIFEFLIAEKPINDISAFALAARLQEHVCKLMKNFPVEYTTTASQSVMQTYGN